MKINKVVRFLCAIWLIASCTIVPKGSILNLKGMTTRLAFLDTASEKVSHQLSPTMGALFWELPFIYNMYVYGPEDDALNKLIHELFFVQTDGSLSSTWSYTKIARYFTPEILGELIGLIHTYNLKIKEESQKPDFNPQRLLDELSQKITQIIEPFVVTIY